VPRSDCSDGREPALSRQSPGLLPTAEDPEVERESSTTVLSVAFMTARRRGYRVDGVEGLHREHLVPSSRRQREGRSNYG
jgi:hypothetical protein